MKAVACKGELWGKCAALGDALRRASEARIKELEDELVMSRLQVVAAMTDPVTLRLGHRVLKPLGYVEADGSVHNLPQMTPPQLSGCPKCGSDMSTTRGLKKEETERGMRVCSRCFTRYDR